MREKLKVLLVDDSEDDAALILRELKRGGFDTNHSRIDTPAGFRHALSKGGWDMVISDYSLPFFNGLDVLNFLKESGADIPFILVSGTIGEEKAVEIMKAGANDYIMKNNLIRLAPAVRRELGEAALRREKRRGEAQLRIAGMVFDNMLESMMVTDANESILSVNKAFVTMTGYHPDDVIGQTPRILKSGRHDVPFYRQMWDCLLSTGHWEGEVWNRRKNGEIYPEWKTVMAIRDGTGRTIHYAAMSHDISEAKRNEEEIKYQTQHDALTGLPNRILLKDRLSHAALRTKKDGKMLAVMLVDMDDFKKINDSLGHATGDLLLKGATIRLVSSLRETDTVSRFGGDEFVVALEDISDEYEVVNAIKQIMSALSEPYVYNGMEIVSTASIGVTLCHGNGETVDDLIKYADIAMHHAKDKGGNNYQFYSEPMNKRFEKRLELEDGLRKAIEKNEIIAYYQPKVCLKTGQTVGMEALVRWRRGDGQIVSPAEFILVAEETGLIVNLGECVLRNALEFIKRMRGNSAVGALRNVSVNLSAKDIERPRLIEEIVSATRRLGVDPQCVELEITESAIIKNIKSAVDLIKQFREAGFSVSLDDFGTGYSSLNYLSKFPVNVLKIDRSFVVDLPSHSNARAVARAIVSMAHDLGIKVVAEGVETESQLEFLCSIGCDEIQGYIFSRPLPEREMEMFVIENGASSSKGHAAIQKILARAVPQA